MKKLTIVAIAYYGARLAIRHERITRTQLEA